MSCNIFGHISNESRILIGYGTIDKIKGLLCKNSSDFILLPWSEISQVVICKLQYNNENLLKSNRFSLFLENDQYIGTKVINSDREAVICSDRQTYFSFDESYVDNTTRSFLLAGVPMRLTTKIGEIEYRVLWKDIENFQDEIIFLPITWYNEINCRETESVDKTIKMLKKDYCKMYSEKDWCESANISYTESCGEGLGRCNDSRHICYLLNDNFICRYPQEYTLEEFYYWSSILSVLFVYVVVLLFYFARK